MNLFPRLAKGLAVVFAAVLAVAADGPTAAAHEIWIAPESFQVEVGEKIEARLRNGDNFKGGAYPYLESFFTRFEIVNRNGAAPVKGRNGDNPAVSQKAEIGGLHVIVHDSSMYDLTYEKFEKFENFLRSKELLWALDAHAERGLPREKIKESYYRYPKALIKVGSGAGRDKPQGQLFELVAEINPYSEAAKDGIRVRLLLEGEPFPGADVQIFHFPEGSDKAVKKHVKTDATGRAFIPAFDRGPFLVNATHLREPRPEGLAAGAVWESIWATLTYELPK